MSKFNQSGSYVCPVFATSGKCGEQDALEVMEQFKDFYETKLSEIDVQGGGDCLELKLKIQKRWIDDLTEQTQMMARIVKELEEEATSRVQMLEDKLRQTSKSAYEVMKRYQTYSVTHNLGEPFQKVFYLENDLKNLLEFIRRIRDDRKWNIDGLQFYDVTYSDLFGKEPTCDCDIPSKETNLIPIANGLNSMKKDTTPKTKQETFTPDQDDCNQSFEEMLKKKTEEFETLKQSMLDMRSALTEEVACKHDIISALKRDVQQLEERCVQADKQTAFKDDIIKELRKEIKQLKQQNKEKEADLAKQLDDAKKTIKQMRPCVDMTSTHTMIDEELTVRRKDKELEAEICRRQCEVDELMQRCTELENTLANSQGRAENLQKAVDLYLNSINVLEASEEKARIEIEQQKMTIVNLQEALVNVKQELDELRQNNQQEVKNYQYLANVFCTNLVDLEERNEMLEEEMLQLIESYKKLQDSNLNLEVEHFNNLQDVAVLETQLSKYQNEFRRFEDSKCASKHELKKLRQQNRCYEQVVDCFKQEMTVMSEQLIHLQEILNLSNQSCREENGQLYNAVVELQKLSEKLQAELIDTEKKVLIANQKNQLKDAKIDELQLIIGQKNADLNIHDEAINEMRMRLEHSVMENHELQATVVSLNSTVMQLQCVVQNCEVESARKNVAKSKGIVCKRSASDCRDDDERRTRKIERLQEECKEQCEKMRTVQNELDRVKEKNKEKTKQLKRQNEELKEKLATSELTKQNLVEQLTQLQNQTTHLAQNECYREHELAQSKQVILELRQTLIELNESLAESELQHMEIAEEFHKNVIQDNREQEDIYLSCRCELALYKKLADRFKASLIETRRNLNELEARNRSLIDELKSKELRISDIQRKAAKKEKETRQYIEELSENLKESKEEEKRLSDFIEHLKTEVQKKIENMAATQEEISTLKVEIKNMIQNQLALNNENDKLLKQVTCLQSTVNMLDEKNRLLKQKLDKLHTDNQNLKEKSKTLTREKEMFCQTIKNLEMELADAKNNRDDICAESRNVVNNVKAWLDEQRKINDKVKRKTQCYCDTIIKLKQENENLLTQTRPLINSTFKRKCPRNYTPCSPPPLECENSWCLGSQGSGSFQDSPRDSPISCTCSIEEWYSPTYKDDDETTDREDDFLNTLEAVTHEMKNNNRKWKNKCQECVVSKDKK